MRNFDAALCVLAVGCLLVLAWSWAGVAGVVGAAGGAVAGAVLGAYLESLRLPQDGYQDEEDGE